MTTAYLATLALTATTILLGTAYFRRYRLTRPPLGTVNLGDVAFMVAGIIVVPYLYLWLPELLVGALLTLSTLSALVFLLEPVLHHRLPIWTLAVVLVTTDLALAVWSDTTARPFLLLNDLVLILLVTGVTNLWAQGGLRARDLAILAAAIAAYDAVATGWLPLTSELVTRLAGLPFVPVLAWPFGDGRWLGIGLGDLLLATLGPLTLRKTYGRSAAILAIATALAAIALVMTLTTWGLVQDLLPTNTFPTMIVLGPLLVAQYLFWERRSPERTTAAYLFADPLPTAPNLTPQS